MTKAYFRRVRKMGLFMATRIDSIILRNLVEAGKVRRR
jgi:hypothetical protein